MRPTPRSCSGPPRRARRLRTSARRCATRSASRFPARRSRRWRPRAAARRSWSSRRSLPFPGAVQDPRQAALAATLDELDRLGIPGERTTILVAGGLGRRAGQRELEALLTPPRARAFHGRVEAHDCEGDLVELGEAAGVPLRVNRALVETDVVVTVTAAESVLDGGAAALLAAANPEALRSAGASSLLETRGSTRLGARARAGAAARAPRPAPRRLARPQPSAPHGCIPRLPVRTERVHGDRPLAAAPADERDARQRPARDADGPTARADGGRGVRRRAVGRARRGTAAGDRAPRHAARPAARRDRRADPVGEPPRPTRAARTRSASPHSGSGSRCGSGATRSRSSTGAPRSCCTASRAASSPSTRPLPRAAGRARDGDLSRERGARGGAIRGR